MNATQATATSEREPEPGTFRFDPIQWIDPALIPRFKFGLCQRDGRSIILGYLDPAGFPTVLEYEKVIGVSAPAGRRQVSWVRALRRLLSIGSGNGAL
jgi:hypothetical protein